MPLTASVEIAVAIWMAKRVEHATTPPRRDPSTADSISCLRVAGKKDRELRRANERGGGIGHRLWKAHAGICIRWRVRFRTGGGG